MSGETLMHGAAFAARRSLPLGRGMSRAWDGAARPRAATALSRDQIYWFGCGAAAAQTEVWTFRRRAARRRTIRMGAVCSWECLGNGAPRGLRDVVAVCSADSIPPQQQGRLQRRVKWTVQDARKRASCLPRTLAPFDHYSVCTGVGQEKFVFVNEGAFPRGVLRRGS